MPCRVAQQPQKDDELVYDSKRMLGTTYDDLCKPRDGSAVADLNRWTFTVERGGASASQPIIAGEPGPRLVSSAPGGVHVLRRPHAMPGEVSPCEARSL